MENRKGFRLVHRSFLLALVLFFTMMLASSGTALRAQAAEKNGWHSNKSGYYYILNGQKVTGLKKISKVFYYFNQNGYRVSGPVQIGKKVYWFSDKNGKLMTGKRGLNYGDSKKTKVVFFNKKKDGSVAINKWVTSGKKKFYADSKGLIKFGTIKVKGRMYHVAGLKAGAMRKFGKSPYDGKLYYAGSNYVLKTGIQSVNGVKYYFSPVTGAASTETVQVGNKYYFFDAQKGQVKSGWVKKGTKYYFYHNGKLKTGRLVLNGDIYWLDPNDGGARVQGRWFYPGSNWYYFNEEGKAQKGLFFVNGVRYFTNPKYGQRKAPSQGWYNYGGYRYLIDKKTCIVLTGFQKVGDRTYYFDASEAARKAGHYGAMGYGLQKIKGNTYYFRYDGTMVKGQWVYDSGTNAYYYLNAKTGAALKGTQKIDGVTYNLGPTGAYKKALSGAWSIRVNRALNTITVYRGSTPVRAMLCSTAKDGVSTPLGTFHLMDKLRWHTLMGPCYGQYCSHITSSILFHSVPYDVWGNIRTLHTADYNRLGRPASAGCIRLCVRDAKWMYENCPVGTSVTVYSDSSTPGPLGKPATSTIGIPWSKNYDPTDPAIPENNL